MRSFLSSIARMVALTIFFIIFLGAFVTFYKSQPEDEKTVERNNSSHPIQVDYPFYVLEKKWEASKGEFEFFLVGMNGEERKLRSDARRYILSEDQQKYPDPESGCGPIALLNLYIWYSKFGLVEESSRHADLKQYKQLKFQEIDQRMREVQKKSRNELGGTNTLEQTVVIDELIQEHATKPLRMHCEIHEPPLELKSFLDLSKHYRAGILSVQPKDPNTGKMEGHHAVLVIRADRSGQITIANWGKFVHGRLRTKPDGQWFIPTDSTQHSLRINQLTGLIPFTPAEG